MNKIPARYDPQFAKLHENTKDEIESAMAFGVVSVFNLNCYKNCKNSNIKKLMIRYFYNLKSVDSKYISIQGMLKRRAPSVELEKINCTMIQDLESGDYSMSAGRNYD